MNQTNICDKFDPKGHGQGHLFHAHLKPLDDQSTVKGVIV